MSEQSSTINQGSNEAPGYSSFMTNQMLDLTINSLSERFRMADQWLNPERSIYKECGYKNKIEEDDYELMFRREPIARRVVEVLPRESWCVQPVIYESEDPDVITSFEDDFLSIDDQLRGEEEFSYYRGDEGSLLIDYLYRLDVEAGKGRYAVLFLGLDDDAPLSEPVTNANKLLYLRVFPETAARIEDLDTKPGARFGKPLLYDITFNDPTNPTNLGAATKVTSLEQRSKKVHWSRVIHVADNLLGGSEIFGTPRMEPVFNRLMDLLKLYGGSAEMLWKGGFGGYSIEAAQGADLTELSRIMADNSKRMKLKEDMEQFMEGLKRYILLIGLQAKPLAPQVVDPTPQIMVQLQAIAMQLGIPMRILMGSERGQLASGQDLKEWHDRLRFRQNTFITPRILVPLIDRLIKVGVLSKPKKKKRGPASKFEVKRRSPAAVRPGTVKTEGGYTVWWPDIASQTDTEKANNAFKIAQALAVYSEKAVQWVVPPRPFFNLALGWTEDEARGVFEASEAYNKKMGHSPAEMEKAKLDTEKAKAVKPTVVAPPAGGNGKPANGVKGAAKVTSPTVNEDGNLDATDVELVEEE